MVPSPTQSAALAALRSFLIEILPAGVPVVQGQDNRVPEPREADYVIFWPTMRRRLATNEDEGADCTFTASIADSAMSVTAMGVGVIEVGSLVTGTGVFSGTGAVRITGQASGSVGGTGVYAVSPATVAGTGPMAAGTLQITQETQLSVQLDVHGPNSADNAQTISTLFRDAYAVDRFAALGGAATPLYADDPRQMPFSNDQQAVENRWVIQCELQTNPVVVTPLQFADTVEASVESVEASFAP